MNLKQILLELNNIIYDIDDKLTHDERFKFKMICEDIKEVQVQIFTMGLMLSNYNKKE